MAAEATMILMDTSAWMLHHESNQFLAQAEALELYCKEKIDFHPDNCVGILAMGGFAHKFFEPTRDLPRIMSRIYGTRVDRDSNMRILDALKAADHVLENIMLDKKRIVLFVGGPESVCGLKDSLGEFGMKLKEKGVAVDVVNFGDMNGPKISGLPVPLCRGSLHNNNITVESCKKESLEALVAGANKNDNSRILHVPQDEISLRDHLSGSPILSWRQSINARQKPQITGSIGAKAPYISIRLVSQIDALTRENDTLTQENDALTQENDKLTQENDKLTQGNEKLKIELEFIRSEFMKCFHKVQADGALSRPGPGYGQRGRRLRGL